MSASSADSRATENPRPWERSAAAQVAAELATGLPDTEIRLDEPFSLHTSFRIGGPADLMLLPRSVEDLQTIVRTAWERSYPLVVVGNGSNLLVRDGGVRGLVLKVAENLSRTRFDGVEGYAQSGALLAAVSKEAAAHSLSSLEFAVGIPGTIGGGVIMNAGAYGGEMKDVVTQVRSVDDRGELHALSAEEMQFGYRRSALQGRGWLVVDIDMRLEQGQRDEIQTRMADFTHQRESKQPLEMPSAGSVFKRPPGRYVGPMVEGLGLKGHTIGGAQVSTKHAGFIVNTGNATAAEVLALIDYVRQRVLDEFGVRLETEVRVIGEAD